MTDKDLIIIGGGAAGLTAAQYGARANLKTMLIEELAPGGQAMIIDDLENYPGFPEPVKGYDFCQKMEDQAVKFGAHIFLATVDTVIKNDNHFIVKTGSGDFTAKAVIIATGAKHRHMEIKGEAEFTGKGVSYCATCDGPFFKNKTILVVGGGDAACDEAMYLSKLTTRVIHIHRRDRFRAQAGVAERVLKNPNIEVRFNTECREISGDKAVNKVRLFNNAQNREYEEPVDAVFVFIGSIPQTSMVAGVSKDENGNIITNQEMETSIPGIFAAGDVRSTPFRQIVVAAGEGAVAAHCASQYIDRASGNEYI